ncbi:glutamate--tRNA ligase [Frankia sp. CNm7]|uniref:Glutamate--tRNA ligase n=1 Tax=Frankia nepalensis TaxID=1836974 RepID=A0A937UQQ1_9ACTN|nr:glutamate--tRNA ligase family protein [Frankia nepalensis]MBL7502215.1 glutamate--tRNA ligase [Frankia nepalensis]MBL7513053.1 glutamate--tRNA ligase [Frankia nepalensis]MBL7519617.1 glutamate--tRNA ligase [Frankia nepalensis]MBL7630328.1 glutamate--tRNA ligase [Frankia nepalensis]
MLDRDEIDALFPSDLPEPASWEGQYPPRDLPAGAMVTRLGPSPTGFAHLGGVYVAMLDKDLARQTGGVYFVRVEDTDTARTVEGATAQFDAAFSYFGVTADETEQNGAYGPYTQSARERIYLSYAREFLRDGRAYLCFATKEELAAAADEQRAAKVPTGYHGRWALWRDAPAERVRAALAAGRPYVVRFRSPGEEAGRVTFTDLVRGELSADANRNDVVILKSSDNPTRLPTYHFAHVVDDHLMRVTHVIRGDEWLSSVPVHLQLFAAAGFEPVAYAHIAPLLKQDGSAKRKLSKRKDPEASVEFFIAAGYPAPAMLYYLRGLINGRLAELPLEQALREPLRLSEAGVSGALVDLVKLEDISADHIATMASPAVLDEVLAWADTHDTELAAAARAEPELAVRALDIERAGVDNPRKDLRKWSDFRPVYGYFFTALFEAVTDPADGRLGGLAPEVTRALCADFLAGYQDLTDGDAWFGQIRAAAAANGFASSPKEYKANKDAYPGSIREASQVIRVLLTGSTRSPGLHLVANALGEAETRRRVGAVLDGA